MVTFPLTSKALSPVGAKLKRQPDPIPNEEATARLRTGTELKPADPHEESGLRLVNNHFHIAGGFRFRTARRRAVNSNPYPLDSVGKPIRSGIGLSRDAPCRHHR